MKKILYIAGGCLAVTLGFIGIFVPGLPTTPFLLLASWLFYHSSERLHRKLNASWLGKYIRRYNNKEGVSMSTKLVSIACMTTMISISIVFFLNDTKTRILVACLGVIGICSILFAVPNQKKEEKEKADSIKEVEEQKN